MPSLFRRHSKQISCLSQFAAGKTHCYTKLLVFYCVQVLNPVTNLQALRKLSIHLFFFFLKGRQNKLHNLYKAILFEIWHLHWHKSHYIPHSGVVSISTYVILEFPVLCLSPCSRLSEYCPGTAPCLVSETWLLIPSSEKKYVCKLSIINIFWIQSASRETD